MPINTREGRSQMKEYALMGLTGSVAIGIFLAIISGGKLGDEGRLSKYQVFRSSLPESGAKMILLDTIISADGILNNTGYEEVLDMSRKNLSLSYTCRLSDFKNPNDSTFEFSAFCQSNLYSGYVNKTVICNIGTMKCKGGA